jgi:protease-4
MTTELPEPSAHQIVAAARLERSRRRWRVVALIAVILAILAGAGRFAMEKGIGGDQIARIEITGTIATDPERTALFKKLGEDPKVKAVILAINSPGGTTAGGEELYESLRLLRSKKPVVAVISELGASAAYMTAIAADRILARRLSIVGSIGVLFETFNAGKLLDTIGIGMEKIASGPLKAEPALDKPMSPEVKASLTALITDSFNWFVDVVAERRSLPRPDVLTLADGRVLSGRQALEAKLIDGIGGQEEAIAWLQGEKKIAPDLTVVTRFPPPDKGWGIGKWLGSEARSAVGLNPDGPLALDGLVSLWQVAQ